ncbi:WecB/TagA/CpsF family glycosyltransferase [Bradyrhizobium erythrophlei]|uniref:N-acetylglucosaminyldiphosphoundecaprenol N-acetyl-beta-D-mannosaminyltransferase n=1 Tax=Bradyrhizobium erythrophlei TaxID=1437360 RepID=A0A1M5PB47_9BRAD|nr:WecB/TagA/CpsF family glycosyltransferase [Bradyrhizobium erythrophlei]SHG99061.1 N-acetylglucosaminyldiphosphoundecaprenol N-acetyl-beta-D-mannosaminyltransferase [Bradyrhizobium erythrophlei]
MADFEMAIDQNNSVSQARPRRHALYKEADVTAPKPAFDPALADATSQSDLTRSVYCVLGMPIDAINVATVVQRTEAAAANRSVFLISTPNLNFLVNSLSDQEFRETLLDSDLCPPDGTPIVWIARLLGLPITERAAGADLLDRLQARGKGTRRLGIFLFGGAKGVAETAANKLNAVPGGLKCVGTMDPGFCEVSEMSDDHIIDAVNSSGADFLAVSLGAKKGQLWLQRNHARLTIPIRAHLGAAINFQAGIVKRAPPMLRTWGLEWLWRIKEEHHLWKRYRNDGLVLLRLLLTRVMPLAVMTRWHQFRRKHQQDLLIKKTHDDQSILISLCGAASELHVPKATACFQEALTNKQSIIIDLSNASLIDARFFGLLIMLRKELKSRGAKLIFTGVTRATKRNFRLSELEYLLSPISPG